MKWLVWFCCFVFAGAANAQNSADSVRMDSVRARLARLAEADPVYLSEVDLSAGKLPLGELLRTVAQVNAVNLCVKTDDSRMITCNFKRAKVTDLLYYVCREYRLNLEVVGNIVSVSAPEPPPLLPKEVRVSFDSVRKLLAYDLLDDNLVAVVKKIAGFTGENIVVPNTLYQRQVSGFSQGLPVGEALSALASSNGLEIGRGKTGTWTFAASETAVSDARTQPVQPFRPRRALAPDQVQVDSLGRISVSVAQGGIQDIVSEVCAALGVDRMFLAPLDRQTTLYVRHTDLVSLLDVLFAGTSFTYRVERGVYLFGTAEQQKGLVTAVVVPMRYRTVEDVPELIPDALKAGVQIKAFPDRNSIIVSGSSRQVAQVRDFLIQVDQSVPLITIEVMIVDSRKSVIQEAGVTAGLGDGPARTAGTLSPGVGMSLSASSVNKLINSLNGFGAVNLGKVAPDFYLTLKALEETGNIRMQSTPKLSTLNGREATLKSGETKYYKEVQNNIIGTQNPIQSESYIWKSVEANMSLKIIPFVSQDGKITLAVEIEQSEFMAREEKDAPPGTATRSFKSQIKVNNEEMVLLGGIDRNSSEKSSSGLPFIARVPILKWLFGTTKNNKVEERLSVFIKPKVIF